MPVGTPERAVLVLPDGVSLIADVWRPNAPGPFPVLLMRHAYGRAIGSSLCYAPPAWYAAQGYIVVVQDVRGRGESGGEFRLFEDEAADGAASVAWAAALPGSTGAVGMFGFSYQGSNQLLAAAAAAAAAGPALRALAPAMLGWDIYTDWATENGAMPLEGAVRWGSQMAAEAARRAQDGPAYAAMRAAAQGPAATESRGVALDLHRRYGHYADWLDRPADDPYWQRIAPAAQAAAIRTARLPMLFVGGFYDSHLPGTLAAWSALRTASPCSLVVGPWAHFPWHRRLGDLDFGPDAESDIDARQVAFFDHWLKGGADDAAPAVRLFDLGLCRWRTLADLPAPNTTLWTGGDGRAAIDLRCGTLGPVPGPAGLDFVTHDPWRPVPSRGGSLGQPPGPFDRAALDGRPDVLTFTTAPARAAFTVAGQVAASVAFRTAAASIDLHCVLSRVAAGRVTPLAEGYATVADAAAGHATIPMRATCVTLQPGEALRLSVAGACYPAFPVNPGSGVRPCDAALIAARPIAIGLRHGEDGTMLHLPVLDGAL